MPRKEPQVVALSPYETEVADKIAALFQITRDEAVSRMTQDAMSRRMRRNTGHSPARVYSIPKRKGEDK